MESATHSRFAKGTQAAVPIIALLVAAMVLLRFPPAQYGFYPECPIHRYLGLLCPGCGTTRALAALLHGQIAKALSLNALTTLSLPFLVGWILFSGRPLRWPQPPARVIYAALTIAAAFTLVRNL